MTKLMIPLIYVGLGGLAGAVLRFLTTVVTQGFSISFPYGTLASNLFGCFLLGAVTTLAVDSNLLSTEARLFLATGLCGSYTTLSSVAYELAQFMKDGEVLYASLYFAATFVGAMLTFFLGTLLVTFSVRPQA